MASEKEPASASMEDEEISKTANRHIAIFDEAFRNFQDDMMDSLSATIARRSKMHATGNLLSFSFSLLSAL